MLFQCRNVNKTLAILIYMWSTIVVLSLLGSDVESRRLKRQDTSYANVEPKAPRGPKPTKTTKSRKSTTESTTTTTTRSTTTLPPPRGLHASVCGMGACGLYCYFQLTKRSFCDERNVCICGDDGELRSDWPCNFYDKGCWIYCSLKGTDEAMCSENNQCVCTWGNEHYMPDNYPDNTFSD